MGIGLVPVLSRFISADIGLMYSRVAGIVARPLTSSRIDLRWLKEQNRLDDSGLLALARLEQGEQAPVQIDPLSHHLRLQGCGGAVRASLTVVCAARRF
jgi:hypothetical protein